tara:strand:+ start:1485 stop:2192 length:708 start_codon:yes stop_codon:yes gene_type:complete
MFMTEYLIKTGTLFDQHSCFYDAIRELSTCVWEVSAPDVKAVETVLQTGTMSTRSKPLSDSEIAELHRTGRFMQRYRKWIDSHTRTEQEITRLVKAWSTKYANNICRKKNVLLFSKKTNAAVVQQLGNVKEIVDIESVSRKFVKRNGETHALIQKSPDRGGKAEVFHTATAHMANGSSAPPLAHALQSIGTVLWNSKREKEAAFAAGKAASGTLIHNDMGLLRQCVRWFSLAFYD